MSFSSRFLSVSNVIRALTAACSVVLACSTGDKGAQEQPSEPVAVEQGALVTCDPNAPFGQPVPAFTGPVLAQGLTFSQDGLTAYLASTHQSGNLDIHRTTRPSLTEAFAAPSRLTTVVNGLSEERSVSLSGDGQRLYLPKQNGSSFDLFVATRSSPSSDFDTLVALPFNHGNGQQDEDPFFLSVPNQPYSELYFASEFPSGTRQIYVSRFQNNVYENPQEVASINDPNEEDRRPVLSADGLRIYFGSTRAGIGGDNDGDIWTASRSTLTATFGPVTNLWSLNSSAADFPVTLSHDGCTLYFASTRDTGIQNQYRLYEATRGPSTPSTTPVVVNIIGNGSITGAPFPSNCSTSCFALGTPGTTATVTASSTATWSGSCTGHGSPSTTGVVSFTPGGVCTVTFPTTPACNPNDQFGPVTPVISGDPPADGLTFSHDELSAFVSSKNGEQYDIYVTTRPNKTALFGPLVPVPNINTGGQERAPQLSENGLKLFLWVQPGSTNSNLAVSSRATPNDDFGAWTLLTSLNSGNADEDPFFHLSESRLYFISDRPGGDRHVHSSVRIDGSFTKPVYVNSLNFPEREERRPIVSRDGLTLYMHRDKDGWNNDHEGNIYIAQRASTAQEFGAPVLIDGLNTDGRDFPVALSKDECTLYFASSRDTGPGPNYTFRIYRSRRGDTSGPPAHCSNGFQDFGETGVDSGGPCASAPTNTCASDANCAAGLLCTNGWCGPPDCRVSPVQTGCGSEAAPCGPDCTANPFCNGNADCPSGLVCPSDNGWRYGFPGWRVCELPGCATQAETLGCGLATSTCGSCPGCTPHCSGKQCGDADVADGCGGRCVALCAAGESCEVNTDCQPGALCMPADLTCAGSACARVCRPADPCAEPDLAAPDCGTATATCGPTCPKAFGTGSCVDRVCGTDPVDATSCGSCPLGQFCTMAGRCASNIAQGPVQVADGPGPNPPTRPVTPAASPAAVPVGALPGTFSVTDRGSSSYSIPIVVPPGRAGIQPAFELRYLSGVPNGMLGRGWTLGGMSAISACNRTYALDGRSAPPGNFNPLEGEPYCLDGQRLIPVAEQNSQGIEYRTAVDGFAKINAVHVADGAMFEFQVQTKDGRILTYGGRDSSAVITGPGGKHTFALSKIADRMGNFMRISYDHIRTEDGFDVEPLPRAVTYTGHGGSDGDREVLFEYEGREDTRYGWMPGEFRTQRTRRLENIQVRAQGTLVRRYELHYQTIGGESRLGSVEEAVTEAACGTTGAICRPATRFDYFDDIGFEPGVAVSSPLRAAGPGPVSLATHIASPLGIVHQWAPSDGWNSRSPLLGLLPAEERRTDRITYLHGSASLKRPTVTYGYMGWAISLEDSRSVENQQAYLEELEDRLEPEIVERYSSRSYGPLFTQPGGVPYDYIENEAPRPHIVVGPTGGETIHSIFTSERVWLVDLDGDGVQDKLYCTGPLTPGNRQLSYKLANARNTPANQHPQVPVDATEADRTGFVEPIFENICGCTPGPFGCWPRKAPTLRLDVDGDGTLNVLFHDGEHSWAGLDFSSGTPVWRTDWFDGVGEYLNPDDYYLLPVDANGDGLRDLLALPEKDVRYDGDGPPTVVPTDEQTYLAINTGRHFELRTLAAPADDEDARLNLGSPLYLSDIDRDGVEEILEPGPDPDVIPGVCGDSPADWTNLRFTPACALEPRPWVVRRIEGSTIRREAVPGITSRAGVTGDFDGDGYQDVLAVGDDKQHFMFHRGKGRLHGLLKTVIDGLGRRIEVAYDGRNAAGELVFESGLENFSETSVSDATCRWPYRCSERVENVLVSSHVESHYLDQSYTQSAVDRDVRYKYRGSRRDLAGYGWLGVWSREVSVRDGLGAAIEDSIIDYATPALWNPATSSIPYVHPFAGMMRSKTTILPQIDSPIAGTEQFSVVSNVQWSSGTSSKGRPFPYILSTSTTQLGSWPGISTPSRLFDRTTVYGVDTYGNITSEVTTSRDIEGLDPIPGTETRQEITREYYPPQTDGGNWLVGLKKSETTASTPRCTSTADCNAKRKSRLVTYEYYDGTPLVHREHREPGGPIALRSDTEYGRDVFGNASTKVTTNGHGDRRETRFQFDSRGLFPVAVTQVGEGQFQTTQVRHDDRFGYQVVNADPNGIDSTWTFDAFGNERHRRGPDGEFTTDYAQTDSYVDSDVVADGLAIASFYAATTTKLGGGRTMVEYDPFGKVVRRSTTGYANSEVREELVYDHRQRLRFKTRPHVPGSATQGFVRYSYDAMNRLILEQYPNGGSVDYFRAIVRHAEQRPGWNVPGAIFGTETIVATAGVLEQNPTPSLVNTQVADRDEQSVLALDGLGKSTRYQYGAFGELEKITDAAGRNIDTTYDAWSRKLVVVDAARGGGETMEYNGFDEVIRVVDAGNREQRMFYDDFGRIERRSDTGEGDTTWSYDGDGTRPNEIGRLVETLSSTGQRTTRRYEPPETGFNRGLPNQITQQLVAPGDPASTRTLTTDYEFDRTTSNIARIDYPTAFGVRVSVAYEYDDSGHVVRVADAQDPSRTHWRFVAAYEGQRVMEERLGTASCGGGELGTKTVRTFDDKGGYVKGIATTCNASTVQALDYGYDESGRMETRSDGAQVEAFRYDALSRITHINQQEHFRYDAQGRGRLEFLRSELGQRDYTYNEQQGRDWILSSGPNAYTQDAVGNVQTRTVNGVTQTFAYTRFDLPASVTVGSSVTDFAYTAEKLRAVKRSPQATTFYAGESFQEVQQADGTRFARSVVYVGKRAIAQITTDQAGNFTRRYLHGDAHGNVHTVTRADGTVEASRNYTPFGEQRSASAGIAQVPYGFAGHEEDADLGLVNMKGRLYDPLIGQFLQADPIVGANGNQGLNRFAYVNNSPLNLLDPMGQFPSLAQMWDSASSWVVNAVKDAGEAIGEFVAEYGPKLVEGVALAIAGAFMGAAMGFGTPLSFVFGVAGALNGFISGWRGTYSLDGDGLMAFVADSTVGIIGTTLGTLVNVYNIVTGADYVHELSYRQNRHVYRDGFHVKSGFAFTQGQVISNIGNRGRGGLLSHEYEHVKTSRFLGPVFTDTYVGWMVGAVVLTAVYMTLSPYTFKDIADNGFSAFETAAYNDNPWEAHAYCNNNPGAYDDKGVTFRCD